ncbi:MAG: ROK family protein [Parachlamydia sp.]|nr:ROK family protein [Parachlamydia sp.]
MKKHQKTENKNMKILVIDIGGNNVKILLSGEKEPRKFPSGPTMTPAQMVSGVKKLARGWKYDRITIGYPGLIHQGKIVVEPHNLAPKWVGFDFEKAFGCPVRMLNDAALQALGSYNKGILLFLGLGTGLGSAMVVEGNVVPMELAHLSYKKGTFEDYVGNRGLKKYGKKKWNKHIDGIVKHIIAALPADDVVIGGGNAKKLLHLPEGCRAGDNAHAFVGGFRLWEEKRTVRNAKVTSPGRQKKG